MFKKSLSLACLAASLISVGACGSKNQNSLSKESTGKKKSVWIDPLYSGLQSEKEFKMKGENLYEHFFKDQDSAAYSVDLTDGKGITEEDFFADPKNQSILLSSKLETYSKGVKISSQTLAEAIESRRLGGKNQNDDKKKLARFTSLSFQSLFASDISLSTLNSSSPISENFSITKNRETASLSLSVENLVSKINLDKDDEKAPSSKTYIFDLVLYDIASHEAKEIARMSSATLNYSTQKRARELDAQETAEEDSLRRAEDEGYLLYVTEVERLFLELVKEANLDR